MQQKSPLRQSEELSQAISTLLEYGWLREEKGKYLIIRQ